MQPEALSDPLAMPSDGPTRNVQALLRAAGLNLTANGRLLIVTNPGPLVLALMHAIEWHGRRTAEPSDELLPKAEQYSDMRYLMEVVEAALDRSIYG
jgi:hypothetical protein